MFSYVTKVAADGGLVFDYEALRPANMLLAHQALHFAKTYGSQVAMREALLKAYLVRGLNPNVVDVVADLGGEMGLDSSQLLAALRDCIYIGDVRVDHVRAVESGITGVPFCLFNKNLTISGVQLPEVFQGALQCAEALRLGAS